MRTAFSSNSIQLLEQVRYSFTITWLRLDEISFSCEKALLFEYRSTRCVSQCGTRGSHFVMLQYIPWCDHVSSPVTCPSMLDMVPGGTCMESQGRERMNLSVDQQIWSLEIRIFRSLFPLLFQHLPVNVFESIIEIVNGAPQVLFSRVQYTLATEEAERIGVDHIARSSITGATQTSAGVCKWGCVYTVYICHV